MDIIPEGAVAVKLSQGLVTIIDAEDLELVSQWKWFASRSGSSYYAQRKHNGTTVKLHRVLANAPDGMQVDHVNHNGLDNRKINLRLCTKSENLRNRRKQKGCSSQYKGVVKHQDGRPKPWMAAVKIHGKRQTLSFATEMEAAVWYDKKAKELYGEFAKLNFPSNT